MKIILSLLALFTLNVSFAQTNLNISCKTYGNPFGPGEANDCWWAKDSLIQDYDGILTTTSICVGWIDNASCSVYYDTMVYVGQNLNTITGIGRIRPQKYFYFMCNYDWQMDSLTTFLSDKIPVNDLFVVYSFNYFDKDTIALYHPNLITSLRNLGFYGIDTMPGKAPFICMGKMGDLSQTVYKYGLTPDDDLYLAHDYLCGTTTSTKELKQEIAVIAYPNPSNGNSITIDVNNYVLKNNCKIVISDALGRMVYSTTVDPVGNSIKLTGLTMLTGVYFISLADQKKTFAKVKLLINKD